MFSVKKLFEEAHYCLEISIAGKKFPDEKCSIHLNFRGVYSPLIFLRFSEVGFSPFRDFPGLIIICKNGLLKVLASETGTERGTAKC